MDEILERNEEEKLDAGIEQLEAMEKQMLKSMEKQIKKEKKKKNEEISKVGDAIKTNYTIMRVIFYFSIFCSGALFGEFINRLSAAAYVMAALCLVVSLLCVVASVKISKKLRAFNAIA